MPSGSVSPLTPRALGARSSRAQRALAPAGALLSLLFSVCLLNGCGRFGFETMPELDLPPNIGTSGGGDTQDPCNLGTPSDCSACGDDCSARNLASVVGYACESATCAIASCAPSFADCNQDPSDGCERAIDTLTDCGSCGQACAIPNGEASCQGGTCQLSQCAPGFGDCDGDLASNGCERPVDTLTNCGACGVTCSTPNGETSCAGGVCQVVSCANGFDDCDGDASTGCEARLDSLLDCGSCGTPCEIQGAQNLACSGGVCSAASCAPSFADCDGDSLSCETDLRSLSNCVSCGVGCGDENGRLANATASCAAGACNVGDCDPGFGDCDASPGNGCEVALDSLVDCGGCNLPCSRANASESCAGGSCVTIGCDPGFDDCDGEAGNGCEAQLGTDAHCAGCNLACGINETCQSGSCVGQFNTFQPDNVSLGSLNSVNARRDILLDCTVTLNTSGSPNTNSWCGRQGPPVFVQPQQNGPDLVVLPMRSLQITPGGSLRIDGSRPVALVVFGDVNLDGTLDVSANGTIGGAGSHWNCDPDDSEGFNGGDTRSDGGNNGGGGGGAFAALGGRGGNSGSNGGVEQGGGGGQPRGNSFLTPLIPGCRGGWGGGCGGAPGGGGGAVELAASGIISINGEVLARGSNGANGCDASGGATGGGSGGGISIQGNQVLLGGNLIAEGGNGGRGANGGNGGPGGTSGTGQDGAAAGNSQGGGGGGGSAGRIRVAGAQGCSLLGNISPPASMSCP